MNSYKIPIYVDEGLKSDKEFQSHADHFLCWNAVGASLRKMTANSGPTILLIFLEKSIKSHFSEFYPFTRCFDKDFITDNHWRRVQPSQFFFLLSCNPILPVLC